MPELTPEKIRELTAVLANAPPAAAARLLVMYERMKVQGGSPTQIDAVLAAIRDTVSFSNVRETAGLVRLPSFERLFFEPFENLFEDGDLAQLLPGGLPRSGLKETWTLIVEEFVPEEAVGIEALGTAAILCNDFAAARDFTQQLRALLLTSLEDFQSGAIAKCGSTAPCQAVLKRLVPLLIAEVRGRRVWPTAFGSKGDLSEVGVTHLCSAVRQLEDLNPDAARELLLLTMANLPRPHEALRVLNKVSLGVDDRKLDMTEFAVIGRRLIATAARAAKHIEEAAISSSFDGAELAKTVERYNQNLHGLEREANLANDGPWRKDILVIRNNVGTRLDSICKLALEKLERALPTQRVQRRTITWTQEARLELTVDQDAVDAAARYLAFIAGSRLFAPLAGFGAARELASKQATAYIDLVCEALLRTAKLPDRPPHFDLWVAATVKIIKALDGVQASLVFERRITVATASRASNAA